MHDLSDKAYISSLGYTHLDSSIPRDATVQFNSSTPNAGTFRSGRNRTTGPGLEKQVDTRQS